MEGISLKILVIMKIVLFLCLIIQYCSCQEAFCPPKENIHPCFCLIGSNRKIEITCEGLSSLEELQKAINGMKNSKLSSLEIDKSNLGTLPANIFNDIEMDSLKIEFTTLTGLTENIRRPAFMGQEKSLQYLEIRDSFLDENSPLTRLSLSHLKKLTFLQLEGNLLPSIGNDWFESGPYALKELFLLDTSTSTLGSHAFSSLTNLQQLSLTGGHISQITREMFPHPALYLESLDFSNNKISTLPSDLFTKMPSLREVFLENNSLQYLNEVSFTTVWSQLSHVFFYGNPLVCDKSMKWIYKYRLPESLQGHCAAPPALLSRTLSNLTLSDFK